MNEDYTLIKINEAIEANVWHTVTPEYLKDLNKRWEQRQKEKALRKNDTPKK